jgi:integrase
VSVFKVKKSPFYQFDFQISGFRFSGSTKSRNERDAAEIEKAKKQEARRIVAESIATGRKPLTVGDACRRWWNEHGVHLNDPDLKVRCDWLAEKIGPEVRLHDVTDDLISELVEARRRDVMPAGHDEKGKQLYRPVGPRTVNKTVPSLLRRIMRRAHKNWNATILNWPNWGNHFLPVVKRPIREISPEEDARIDEVESIEFCQLREFAEIMGLRRGEVLLTWPQVSFERSTIAIIGKGDKPAILPLTRRAYAILWGLRGNDPVLVFTFVAQRTRVCPKTGRQFVKGQRYPMTYYGVGTNRRRKWTKAGVDARFHDTRHTTGMRTLRTTGNLKLVQKLLRHSKITTTADFYTDALVEDIREGMEKTAESQKKSQTTMDRTHKTLMDKA